MLKNKVFGQAGGVLFGEHIVLGRNTRIECTGGLSSISVGVRIGNCSTFGNDCFFGAAGEIEIGNNCWIGSGVVFLDGAELGDGCVVGANAVVTKKFPPN